MKTIVMTLATLALMAVSPGVEAATAAIDTGQHAQVMSNIYAAQQRNNAAISHVQNSIAATRRDAH